MSLHKARPDAKPDPTQPASTVLYNGRGARPHAEIDGKPILGGIQNAVVAGQGRNEKEEKANIEEYHAKREEVKKAGKETFDDKTGKPKSNDVLFGAKHENDAQSVPAEEKKKNVEVEVEKKPDVTVQEKK